MEGDGFVFIIVVEIDQSEPCILFHVHWDGHDIVEEKVVVVKDLSVGCCPEKVNCSFWQKDAIMQVIAEFGCHLREEFSKELGILWRAFNSDNFHRNVGRLAAMTDPRLVQFKGWKNHCELIAIQHGIKLG